jgi:hypothetical protein
MYNTCLYLHTCVHCHISSVCVCVCLCVLFLALHRHDSNITHIHTHARNVLCEEKPTPVLHVVLQVYHFYTFHAHRGRPPPPLSVRIFRR